MLSACGKFSMPPLRPNNCGCFVGLDDYNIYRTLKEMFISRQIVRIQEGGTKELETGSAQSLPKRSLEFAPLRLQPHLSLEPHDQIVSLSIDATTSSA